MFCSAFEVSQTDLRLWMCLAHGTKLCILDFCLRFSKDDYLRRLSSRGGVLFPRGRLLGGLHPIISRVPTRRTFPASEVLWVWFGERIRPSGL